MNDRVEQVADGIMNSVGKDLETAPPAEEARAKTPEEAAIEKAEDEVPIYEPSQGAALLQDLVQRMDLRAAARLELIADLRKIEVAAERFDREQKKALDEDLAEERARHLDFVRHLEETFKAGVEGRKETIAERMRHIASIDKSLDQMRKQAVAEVAKLAPERKGA